MFLLIFWRNDLKSFEYKKGIELKFHFRFSIGRVIWIIENILLFEQINDQFVEIKIELDGKNVSKRMNFNYKCSKGFEKSV